MRLVRSYPWHTAVAIWLVIFVLMENTLDEVASTVPLTAEKPVVLPVIATISQQVQLPPPPPLSQPATEISNMETSNKAQPSPQLDQQLSQKNSQLQGRALLAQLEQGDGPDINIAWPSDRAERNWLQQRLYRCGVRLGKWRDGRLRAIEQGYDRAVSDTVSGFLRIIEGEVSALERARLDALPGVGLPVRVFPRELDVVLLAGFSRIAAGDFVRSGKVRARYSKVGNAVVVGEVALDGRILSAPFTLLSAGALCAPKGML